MASVFEVRDEVWEVVEPLIPPIKTPEKQGRRPVVGRLDRRQQRLDDLPHLVADLEDRRHRPPSTLAVMSPAVAFAVAVAESFVQQALSARSRA